MTKAEHLKIIDDGKLRVLSQRAITATSALSSLRIHLETRDKSPREQAAFSTSAAISIADRALTKLAVLEEEYRILQRDWVTVASGPEERPI